MYNQKKIAVIIAAAGSGNRMGGGIPKQYMDMQGKTVLSRSVEAFSQNCRIDEIYIAVSREYMDFCRRVFAGNSKWDKVKRIVEGGTERQDSVYSVLSVIPEEIDYVLVHDGARPFVTGDVIDALIERAVEHGAAVTAVPVKDTIKSAEEGVFTGTLDRSRLYSVQTPQGFERKLLVEAHQRAYRENFYGTDDAVLVENMGEKVYLVKGDYSNIKITTIDDISTGEAILKSRSGEAFKEDYRVGTGFDVHQLTPDRKLVLGGVELIFEKGLLGHSDADVLLHAIMDALLGAASLGDIGQHFPDTDESYRGISSLLLLGKVGELLKKHGYLIGNIDSTVIAQRPKIAPYIGEMKRRISEVLDMDESRINIKGTTTERLGFCGREEGIAAQASVTIKRRMNR